MEKIDLDDLEELKQMCREGDLNNITRMVVGGKEFVYVVRCVNCKHWGRVSKNCVGGYRRCALNNAWQAPEFYCASGERCKDGSDGAAESAK